MMSKYKIFIALLLFLPLGGVLAQTTQPVPVEVSTEKVKIQGQVFYVHRVLKGQTLYSITRAYGITQDELHQYNPQVVGSNLQEGMLLQIPIVTGRPVPATVPATETLTTPATAPAATLTAAPDRNPDMLYKPLDADVEEIIDKKTPETRFACHYIETMPDKNRCEAYVYNPEKTRFHLAILLPLSAQFLTQQTIADSVGTAANRQRSSDNFVEFYGGVLMAVQDMKEKGFVVDVSVFDVAETAALEALISSQKLKNMNLIIGPIYAAAMARLLPYADQHNIPVVSPLDPKTETLLPEYAGLFQVSPPQVCQQQQLLSGISSEKDHVVLVYDAGGDEQALMESYKSMLSGYRALSFLPYKVAKGVAVRDSIRKRLVAGKENRIIVASNNEALVTDFTSNLGFLQTKMKCPITLYGQARWRNFDNVDVSFLHNLNLHLVLPFFVDYKDTEVKNFVARYRLDFNTDPSQFAFQGYDVAKYFLTALHRYGPQFENCIPLLRVNLLQGNYQFHKQTAKGGFINTGAVRVHYMPDFDITKE